MTSKNDMEHLSIALRALFSKQDGDEILRLAGFLKNKEFKDLHYDMEKV